MKCYYCNEEFPRENLRPYGPAGELVCFGCAMDTPERREQTLAATIKRMEYCAAEGNGVIILTKDGPIPG